MKVENKIHNALLAHYYKHGFDQAKVTAGSSNPDPVFSQIAKKYGVDLPKVHTCANDLLYSKLLSLSGELRCGNERRDMKTLPPLGSQALPSFLYKITPDGIKKFESISYRCILKRSRYYVCDHILVRLVVVVVAGIISEAISVYFR